MAELSKHQDAIKENGGEWIIIGNGQPQHIEDFKKDVGFEGRILTDPSRNTYKILEFKRSVGSLLGFKAIKEGIRSISAGAKIKSVQGDAYQQGGALIIGPGDNVKYYYRSKKMGDNPPIEEMITACKN